MKKLRVTAKVYDRTKFEYVARHAEIPISDELAQAIVEAIHPKDAKCCVIKAWGHGDKDGKMPRLSTPLRNESRYFIDPQLLLIDEDEETNEGTIVGGWSGM